MEMSEIRKIKILEIKKSGVIVVGLFGKPDAVLEAVEPDCPDVVVHMYPGETLDDNTYVDMRHRTFKRY